MKAWVCREFSDPYDLNFTEWAAKEPDDHEVQVAVRAAGLSFGETIVIGGRHQSRPPLPYIFGTEGAGTVIKCGALVTRFKPGDDVIIHDWNMFDARSGGCCAEITTAHENHIFPKPKNISFEQAAAFPSNYMTAYNAFFHRCSVEPGEVLVVHGAGGGAGLAAVQFGKMLGATVIATGGSAEKLAAAKAEGADHIINYRSESVRDRILELTGGRGADIYYDPVGGDMFEASMRAIAPGGRILIIGFMSGTFAKAATNIVLVKMISLIGVEAGIFTRQDPARYRRDMERIVSFVADGKLRPHYGNAFAMANLKEAIAHLDDRRIIGKCVLVNAQDR